MIPQYLEVEFPPGAEARDCFGNVERVIAEHGGSVQYGWQLWETLPGVMLEAEFHAVWLDRNGNLRDVTPKELSFERSAFLPDPTLVYEGRQIDNVRVALRPDPLIHEFIEVAEAHFEATNRGRLADLHGDITPLLTPEEKTEIEELNRRRLEIASRILQTYYVGP